MRRNKGQGGNEGGGMRFRGRKEQGEWAELCFMTRAKGLGMGVLKPYGDSRLYDVAVEDGGKILRVQVKCTMYRRRGSGYSLNIIGPGRKKYPKGSVDFFAVFIIPIDEWYIVPYAAMGRRRTMHVTPGSRRAQWAPYLEAWELLRGEAGGLVIRACVDLEFEEIAGLDLGGGVRYLGGTAGSSTSLGMTKHTNDEASSIGIMNTAKKSTDPY